MKLNELIEQYGNYEVKEGFLNFLKKPKPKTVWDLQIGDRYYLIDSCGEIRNTVVLTVFLVVQAVHRVQVVFKLKSFFNF